MADSAENRPSVGQVPLLYECKNTPHAMAACTFDIVLNLEGVILLSRQRWTVSVPALGISSPSPTFPLPSLPCASAEDLLSYCSFTRVYNSSLNEKSSECGESVVECVKQSR